jgi:hypothetical protein
VKISKRGLSIAIVALFALMSCSRPARAAGPGVFNIGPTDTNILAPDGNKVIGHGHYDVLHQNGLDVVKGENKYFNGEYDQEEQTVRPAADGQPPVLVSYRHRYFNADGTPQYEDSLDAVSGTAGCKRYDSSAPDIREKTLTKIPPDTYAGATQLMLLVGRLRQGAESITFHSYNCLPSPTIVPITARPLSNEIVWPLYPGKLMQLEMKPDLGWLNPLIAPFVPKVYGWFDPSNTFNYVGGEFDRYYKGRHVLMVRTHDSNPIVQGPVAAPLPR